MNKFLKNLKFLIILGIFLSIDANAGIVIKGTRVIFEEGMKDTNITMKNTNPRTSLVQVWLENFSPENKITVPFTPIPPLFKMAKDSEQTIRVVKNKANLAKDRETIFYINFLDVAPKDKSLAENTSSVQISIQTRLKFFYRPKLKMPRSEAEQKLDWRLIKKNKVVFIEAKNKSPFYISLEDLIFEHKNKKYTSQADMIAPFSTSTFKLDKFNLPTSAKGVFVFKSIDDYGNKNEFKVKTAK